MHHVTGFYYIFHSLVRCFLMAMHAPMYFSQLQSLSNVSLPTSHPTNLSGDPEPAPNLLTSMLIPHSSSPITEVNIAYATRQANLVLVGAIITSSIWHILQGAEQAFHDMLTSQNRVMSLVLLMLVQLMVRVLWILTYLFFAELAPSHRAYTSSQHLCSSAHHSSLLWTGCTLGYLWRCLLMRCLVLCLIAAFL